MGACISVGVDVHWSCTGKAENVIYKGKINAPQQTQTAVRVYLSGPQFSIITQPPSMGVMCYTDFHFAVIWDSRVVWRSMTCTQTGLTFPPLGIRGDPSWQKALCGNKGHILPKWVLRDTAVTRTPQKWSPKVMGFCSGFLLWWFGIHVHTLHCKSMICHKSPRKQAWGLLT